MPLYLLLNNYNAFIRVCHSFTPPSLLKETVQHADVVISAAGVPSLIKADWVKEGAVVIDVGINYVEDGGVKPTMCGDVELNELLLKRASKVTPVPGGVGPMTVTMLLSNLVKSWELQNLNLTVGGSSTKN